MSTTDHSLAPGLPAGSAAITDFYRCIDSGDLDGMLALFAADARYHRPGYQPLVGRGAIEHFYRHDRVISSGRHVLDRILIDGDQVAVNGSFAGRSRDGEAVQHRFAEFFQVAPDGRFSLRETYFAVRHV